MAAEEDDADRKVRMAQDLDKLITKVQEDVVEPLQARKDQPTYESVLRNIREGMRWLERARDGLANASTDEPSPQETEEMEQLLEKNPLEWLDRKTAARGRIVQPLFGAPMQYTPVAYLMPEGPRPSRPYHCRHQNGGDTPCNMCEIHGPMNPSRAMMDARRRETADSQ